MSHALAFILSNDLRKLITQQCNDRAARFLSITVIGKFNIT